MKNIIFYLIVFFLYSCKSNDCKNPNYELINQFEKNLSIVKNAQNPKAIVSVDEYRSALLYLSNTTNIMTKADYSSTIGYADQEDYNHDMDLWKRWLKKNRCSLK